MHRYICILLQSPFASDPRCPALDPITRHRLLSHPTVSQFSTHIICLASLTERIISPTDRRSSFFRPCCESIPLCLLYSSQSSSSLNQVGLYFFPLLCCWPDPSSLTELTDECNRLSVCLVAVACGSSSFSKKGIISISLASFICHERQARRRWQYHKKRTG